MLEMDLSNSYSISDNKVFNGDNVSEIILN